MRRIILASLLVGFALGGAASAAPPTVKLQGSLADLSGQEATPADGTFGLTVRVYDAMTGGSELASFGPSSVEVRGGLYEIELPLTPDVFDGSVRYVEVEIDGEVLTPRIRIVSTPYALRASVAETAESVADGSVDGDALAPGAVSLVSLGIVCGTGETLVYNGSAWTCAALPGQATPVCPLGSELICYEGPDETRDVGNCGPGTSACLADQSGWGPCLGQVLPEADEDCESVGDEDCDGIADLDDPDCLGTLTPSDRIDLVKNTPEDVDIVGATVTYVRPAIGNDPAGFYIQADPLGPALLIAVDPASLSPIPQAGDVVDFTPTSEGEVGGQRRVTALTNFVRTGTGSFIADQDVTGTTDLVTNRVDYDAELVSLDLSHRRQLQLVRSRFRTGRDRHERHPEQQRSAPAPALLAATIAGPALGLLADADPRAVQHLQQLRAALRLRRGRHLERDLSAAAAAERRRVHAEQPVH